VIIGLPAIYLFRFQ